MNNRKDIDNLSSSVEEKKQENNLQLAQLPIISLKTEPLHIINRSSYSRSSGKPFDIGESIFIIDDKFLIYNYKYDPKKFDPFLFYSNTISFCYYSDTHFFNMKTGKKLRSLREYCNSWNPFKDVKNFMLTDALYHRKSKNLILSASDGHNGMALRVYNKKIWDPNSTESPLKRLKTDARIWTMKFNNDQSTIIAYDGISSKYIIFDSENFSIFKTINLLKENISNMYKEFGFFKLENYLEEKHNYPLKEFKYELLENDVGKVTISLKDYCNNLFLQRSPSQLLMNKFIKGMVQGFERYNTGVKAITSGLLKRNPILTIEEFEVKKRKDFLRTIISCVSIPLSIISFIGSPPIHLSVAIINTISFIAEQIKNKAEQLDILEKLKDFKNAQYLINQFEHYIKNQHSLDPEKLINNISEKFTDKIYVKFTHYIVQYFAWRYENQIGLIEPEQLPNFSSSIVEEIMEIFALGRDVSEKDEEEQFKAIIQDAIDWVSYKDNFRFLIKSKNEMPTFLTSEAEHVPLNVLMRPESFEVKQNNNIVKIPVISKEKKWDEKLKVHNGNNPINNYNNGRFFNLPVKATQKEINQLTRQAQNIKNEDFNCISPSDLPFEITEKGKNAIKNSKMEPLSFQVELDDAAKTIAEKDKIIAEQSKIIARKDKNNSTLFKNPSSVNNHSNVDSTVKNTQKQEI